MRVPTPRRAPTRSLGRLHSWEPRRPAVVSRRDLLSRLAALGVSLPAAAWSAACGGESARDRGASLTRPVLRAWADDIVHLVAPPHELPVAYVSMAHRHVYVDHDHRDRAAWLLGAHISVSTALWRIPLPGDPAGQPVVPGDEAREFEELPMRAWDPGLAPAMDDIRLLRGVAGTRRVELACMPVLRGDESGGAVGTPDRWVSGASLALTVAGPIGVSVVTPGRSQSAAPAEVPPPTAPGSADADVIREDFHVVGTALRFDGRECLGTGDLIQLASWAVR